MNKPKNNEVNNIAPSNNTKFNDVSSLKKKNLKSTKQLDHYSISEPVDINIHCFVLGYN